MSDIILASGFMAPYGVYPTMVSGAGQTLDATGEKVAFIGRVFLNGRPAAAKTIDTGGSSKFIWTSTGSPVFDNAASEFRIGFQGVDFTTGVPTRPDGTWSCYSSVTIAADSTPPLTTSVPFFEKAPTNGSLSLAHGDLVAIVLELTTRGGSDSLVFSTADTRLGVPPGALPATVTNVSGSWAGAAAAAPAIHFVTNDGTLGYIDGSVPAIFSSLTWNDSSSPDEYGEIFQLPFDGKIDALCLPIRLVDATSDFTVSLYSDPLGTPVPMATEVMLAEKCGVTGSENQVSLTLASEIALSKNTDYCVAVKATGAGNIRFNYSTLYDGSVRALFGMCTTTLRGASRNNGSGAFSVSATNHYPCSCRMSTISGFGAGGGLLTHPGMSGGMRG